MKRDLRERYADVLTALAVVLTGEPVRWVDAGEVRIHVRVRGVGPELVMINGIGAGVDIWEPLARRLESTRRLVMVDMPGTGDSPPLRCPVGMSRLAAVLAEVLDVPGIDPADVLGYSWGGALAQ